MQSPARAGSSALPSRRLDAYVEHLAPSSAGASTLFEGPAVPPTALPPASGWVAPDGRLFPDACSNGERTLLLERVLSSPELNDALFARMESATLMALCDQALSLLPGELSAEGGEPSSLPPAARAGLYALLLGGAGELRARAPSLGPRITALVCEELREAVAREKAIPLAYVAWHLLQDVGIDPLENPRARRCDSEEACRQLRAAVSGLAPSEPQVTWSLDFAHPELTLRELSRDDGTVPLFRVIRGDYVPKHASGAYTAAEGDTYSYSLNPYVCPFWRDFEDAAGRFEDRDYTVLVSFPALQDLVLMAPIASPGEPAPRCIPQNCAIAGTPSPDLKVSELSVLQEMKVPVSQDAPQYAIALDRFNEIAGRFAGRAFSIDDLLAALAPASRPLTTV